jgi:hypothetical protein
MLLNYAVLKIKPMSTKSITHKVESEQKMKENNETVYLHTNKHRETLSNKR